MLQNTPNELWPCWILEERVVLRGSIGWSFLVSILAPIDNRGKGNYPIIVVCKDGGTKPAGRTKATRVTFAHGLAVVPVGIAGVDALNCARTLFHNKSRGAGKRDNGAQLIRDVTATKIPVGHVGLPAVFIVKSYQKGGCQQRNTSINMTAMVLFLKHVWFCNFTGIPPDFLQFEDIKQASILN